MSGEKFKIFEPRMPTAEEHRAVSLKWLERVRPTLIDQWPSELAALSMPTELVPVPDGLLDEMFGMHDGGEPGPAMNALVIELDARIGWNRKFVKLNSRSPKDWPWPFAAPATISGKEAVSMLSGSERILDDLFEFKWLPEQPAYICLRDWVWWIRGENEFRCFVKDGKLIAVTHYDYTKPVPETLIKSAPAIRARIDTYFADKLSHCLPIENVVFDLALNHDGSFMLIEINPYGSSDPCWFGTYSAVENASSLIQFEAPPNHSDHIGGR